MYFCDACIHTCDMIVYIYVHVLGCDASVSSFLCAIEQDCTMSRVLDDTYVRLSIKSYFSHTYVYVCRERTYTIICFYVHAYTGIFRDRLDQWHDIFIHMYSRDASIHLRDTMVHICIHIHGKMHLKCLMHVCDRTLSCM